jgi:hypothetical protein
MTQNPNSENETHGVDKLDPEYSSRCYPSKWDVSELCKPNGGRDANKRNKKLKTGKRLKTIDDSVESMT